MKLLISISFCIIFSTNLISQDFRKHQWKNRVLVVFTNNVKNDSFKKQVSILSKNQQNLTERKLVVYYFTKDKYIFNFDEYWQKSRKFKKEKETFKLLLIGLDGGIKLQQDSILSTEKLFAIIDGMPMRKRELSKNNK